VKILTDTHTLVWTLSNPESLGRGAREALPHLRSQPVWPICGSLCSRGANPALAADPLPWWEKYVVRSGIRVLSIRTRHIAALATLPDLHKDPFDRIPVAQALAERLTLASKDAILARYGAPVVWD
jgi:PIN domain nuclease of toxin-antitoxin system